MLTGSPVITHPVDTRILIIDLVWPLEKLSRTLAGGHGVSIPSTAFYLQFNNFRYYLTLSA